MGATSGACREARGSLVHSARINGHDPNAYLKDVRKRLPTQPANRVKELLPHHQDVTPGCLRGKPSA